MLIMIAMSQHFLCEEVIYIFEKIKKKSAMVTNTANTNSNQTAASLYTYLLIAMVVQTNWVCSSLLCEICCGHTQ